MNDLEKEDHSTRSHRRIWIACAAGLASAFSAETGLASNGTWLSTAMDSNWGNSADWVAGNIPGDTSQNPALADIANLSGTSTQLTILPDANREIGNITFGATAGNYTIGSSSGNPLYLAGNGSGEASWTATSTNITETFAGPLVLETSYEFVNNSTDPSDTFVLSGGITNNSTTAGVQCQLKGTNTGANTVSGTISDGTTEKTLVNKLNAGTWVITSTNTYTSSTTVSQGTLIAASNAPSGAAGAFGNSTAAVTVGMTVTTASNASLLAGYGSNGSTIGRSITVAALGTGGVETATLGSANTAGTSSFTGASITLSRPLTLQAAAGGTANFQPTAWSTNNNAITVGTSGNTGTVTLSTGISTTGGITANYGALNLNATMGGSTPLTINSGATLTGTGTASNTVSIANGGIIAPGPSNGLGTINTGSLTLAGTYNAVINTTQNGVTGSGTGTPVAGAASLINVAGTVNLTGSTLNLSLLNAGSNSGTYTYVLIQNDGSDAITGAFSSINTGGASFTINYDYNAETGASSGGNDVAISITATPEPNSALLLGIVVAPLLLGRRRRHIISSSAR
jgi:hypothetical protein